MTCRLFAVCFDASQPLRLAQFWAGVLGREVVEDAGGALVPGEGTQLSLRFVASRAEKVGLNRMHLHLTSASPADQQHTVATALRLGARHLDVGQRPEEGHVVLADPEGNEFCVIEPVGFQNPFTSAELAFYAARSYSLIRPPSTGRRLIRSRVRSTTGRSERGGRSCSDRCGRRPL
jgi:Glyoxalase-like domain